MPWLKRALLALTLLPAIGLTPVLAQRNKLDDHLRHLADARRASSRVDVIVTVQRGSLRRVADAIRRRGDHVRSAHSTLGALAVEMRQDNLVALAADPLVEAVSFDAPVSVFAVADQTASVGKAARPGGATGGTPPLPALTGSVLRTTLGLDTVSYTGQGIGVAIIDSGIQPLADFNQRITAFRDFTGDDARYGRAAAAYDDYGHGTHVAGLIGSDGSLSDGEFRGVAPAVRMIGLKVLDSKGRGTTSDVIAALDFAIRYKAALAIDVVNLSLGHPIYERAATDPLVQAVETATRAGLIVVAAAGNYGKNPRSGEVGYAGITSPGNAPSAITVGALSISGTIERDDDRIADYSSRGPTWYDALLKPDVVAPGDNLLSNVSRSAWLAKQYPQLLTRSSSGGTFIALSGTSMSTGVATGVVALALEAQRVGAFRRTVLDGSASFDGRTPANIPLPGISSNLVKAVLQYSALPVSRDGVAYDALTQGAGAVNAAGAARLAFAVDVTAPPGTLWMADFGQPSTTIAGRLLPWKQSVYWGPRELIGPSITVKEPAWLGHVVWGTDTFWTTVEDFGHIVWGANIDWSPVTGEHIVWGTGEPFVLSQLSDEHIVWGSMLGWDDHIVWGSGLLGFAFDEHIVWGSTGTPVNTAWGSLYADEHIVWGTQTTTAGLK